MAEEHFGADEAEEILKRAAGRRSGGGGVTRAGLLAMAAELDIAPEDVEAAIIEAQTEREDASLRKQFIVSRHSTLLPHLVPFLSVNLMLLVIWWITGGGHPWFLYPLMGWGIGLACHIAVVWPTSGASFEAEFASYKARHARKESTKERRTAKKSEKSAVSAEDVAEPVVATTSPVYNTQPTKEETKNILQAGR